MSEVSGVGFINPPDDIRIGTVGLPIKEVTPSVKLKREPIAKKYATEIEALYA